MPSPPARFTWTFYETQAGQQVVSDEIHDALPDKAGTVALGVLMTRISEGTTLSRDTKHLDKGLVEARLTYQGNEYRLYYAFEGGRQVLLGLHFHNKKGKAGQDRAIEVARRRLADWQHRDIR